MPERGGEAAERERFAMFPQSIGDWQQSGPREALSDGVARVLGADDYHQVNLVNPDAAAAVGLFMAWYNDQTQGGVHSPEVCLPGSGWEIAWLERTDIAEPMGSDRPFAINRVIIQKGNTRMMVYYWFQQRERRIAWDIAAKFWLMVDGITTGRTDGALVRLTTAIGSDETDAAAEARLQDVLEGMQPALPRFIPEG
jgi:EpsI family protein